MPVRVIYFLGLLITHKATHSSRASVGSIIGAEPAIMLFFHRCNLLIYTLTFYAVPYGNWFDWMKRWYPSRNNQNMLTLYYEDMVQVCITAI